MDLQSRIGVAPCGAGRDQLGHAGLYIAAFSLVLFAGGIISQLTGGYHVHQHHRQLIGNAGKFDQSLAKLFAARRIVISQFECAARHAHGTGGGLDACALKCAHQLFEALTFFSAQQGIGGRGHRIKL